MQRTAFRAADSIGPVIPAECPKGPDRRDNLKVIGMKTFSAPISGRRPFLTGWSVYGQLGSDYCSYIYTPTAFTWGKRDVQQERREIPGGVRLPSCMLSGRFGCKGRHDYANAERYG